MEASQSTQSTVVIEPAKGWNFPDLRELWTHRDLIYFLARRDILVRYQQAVIGFFWVIIQPVFLAVVFAVFLGVLARLEPLEGFPLALLAISGLVPWFAFARGVELCSQSTVAFEALITKVYVPRVVIPVTSLAAPALELLIGIPVVIAAGLVYGFVPGIEILALPVILALIMLLALGFGLWFAALNVKYRDFSVLIPSLTLVGLFITPIAYPLEQVEQTATPALQYLYALNPMVGLLEAFRWSLLGLDWPGLGLIAVPIVASVVLLVSGLFYFERAQRSFADVI
jgi:lipopolysaccharide transport system permease protein